MTNDERELKSLIGTISDLIERVEERNMSTILSLRDNELFMIGYKSCLRDLGQRVHEVFLGQMERMKELGFDINYPDRLIE